MPQMFDHMLDVVKGYDPLRALTKKLPVDSNNVSTAVSGAVVHVDPTNLNFVVGPGGTVASPVKTNVPLFLLVGTEKRSAYYAADGWEGATLGLPEAAGNLEALVGMPGYEVQTTEFDTTGTYSPNDYLTDHNDGTNWTGKVRAVTATELGSLYISGMPRIVGVVSTAENVPSVRDGSTSSPQFKNAHNRDVLSFWTYFLPGK